LKTVFWRDDRLQQVIPVLVALVAPAGASQDGSPSGGREIVSASLVALGDTATDDGLLKRLNLDVLMHTRSDDTLVRIFALQCAHALWTAHGSKLVGAWAQSDEYSKYMHADGWPLCFFFCSQLIRVRVGDGNVHR
jgi:U3 small nucleolar RNA-associated protein 10